MHFAVRFLGGALALGSLCSCASSECAKDADCKGDRICVEGGCTEPREGEGEGEVQPAFVTFTGVPSWDRRTDSNFNPLAYDFVINVHNAGDAGSFTVRAEGFDLPRDQGPCPYEDEQLGPFTIDAGADLEVEDGFDSYGTFPVWEFTLMTSRGSGVGQEQTDQVRSEREGSDLIDLCRNR